MRGVRQKTAPTTPLPLKQVKQGGDGLHVAIRSREPSPTPLFEAYWRFAAERQRIFRRRLLGADWSTDDVVLQRYRFTNVYRASDRVSQYLIRHVIYDQHRAWRDVFLRVILFKLFNKIETWVELEKEIGAITSETFEVEAYSGALDRIREKKGTLYSAAYIMPSAGNFGSQRKHVNHLRLVQYLLESHLDERLLECRNAREAFSAILESPSIGHFLAYQLLTDLCYSSELGFGESEFVAPGPGALDGLHKCFQDPGDFTPSELIIWTMERQEEEFRHLEIDFDDLWGRPIQLIDCQNLYCEISKYAREAFPEISGKLGRKKIKQTFRPRPEPISAWYPPRWGINSRIKSWIESAKRSRLGTP